MKKINEQRVYNFYKRNNKWLGIIDYKSLAIFLIFMFLIVKTVFVLPINYLYKIYVINIFLVPCVIFILYNTKEESIIDKLFVILIYFVKRKKYIKMEYYARLNTIYMRNVKK